MKTKVKTENFEVEGVKKAQDIKTFIKSFAKAQDDYELHMRLKDDDDYTHPVFFNEKMTRSHRNNKEVYRELIKVISCL